MLALCFAGGISCGAGGVRGGQEAHRHPPGTRGTSPPKQPAGHALAAPLGTLWPYLDPLQFSLRPALAYTLCSWHQQNPEHRGLSPDCIYWALAEPFHSGKPEDGWGGGARTSFPCHTGTQQQVLGLGLQGVCAHPWVLLRPRKTLIGTLLPRCKSNLSSSRH